MSDKRRILQKTDIALLALAAANTAATAVFAMRPTTLRQLLVMGLLLLVLATLLFCLVRVVSHWRRLGWLTLLAPAALVASLPLGAEIGQGLRTWRFERDLPRYQALADWALTRAVRGESVVLSVPPEARDLAYTIDVNDEPGCGKIVDLFWGAGFPAKHTARRYVEIPAAMENKACRGYWSRGQRRSEHWFEASD
ncbi:hypothetical protein ACI2IY_22170 [Lysobacter enzymogenes]|uniref:hypothetical protein n=1 Tax=Lysobacter enzymogenes TaxID=69 RepID=UPI00384E1366